MGIDLAKTLELYFVEKDPSIIRSGKFKRELQSCLAPYHELLAQLQSQKSVELNNEGIKCDEKFSPVERE